MPAYAVAYLRRVDLGPAILEYVASIDATLAPFEGRFLIHGGPVDPMDGHWSGDLVVIEFPDRASAHAWYASPAYQAILPLRTDHAEGDTFIVDGLPDGYRAADKLAKLMPDTLSQGVRPEAQDRARRALLQDRFQSPGMA